MRNAAATFDDDFGASSTPRKSAGRARKPAAAAKRKKTARRSMFAMHGVARYAAIAMAAAIAIAILFNALVMQKGHHPAPLFARSAPPPTAARVDTPASSTLKADAPNDPQDAETTPAKTRKTTTAAHATAPHATEAAGNDAIARLLAGEAPPMSSRTRPTNTGKTGVRAEEARTEDAKTVSAAQRALTKLGFKVPATGTLGPATRKAIEAFEKDRHLPIKGTLDRRIAKRLAAESVAKSD